MRIFVKNCILAWLDDLHPVCGPPLRIIERNLLQWVPPGTGAFRGKLYIHDIIRWTNALSLLASIQLPGHSNRVNISAVGLIDSIGNEAGSKIEGPNFDAVANSLRKIEEAIRWVERRPQQRLDKGRARYLAATARHSHTLTPTPPAPERTPPHHQTSTPSPPH